MPFDINDSWFIDLPDSNNVVLVYRRPVDPNHHLAKGNNTTRDERYGYYTDIPSALAGYVKHAANKTLEGPAAEIRAKLDAIHEDVKRFAATFFDKQKSAESAA